MARLLNADAYPVFGYFFTTEPLEIVYYVQRLLSTHNQSVLVNMHASALFVNAAGEQSELHLPPTEPILLDPASENVAGQIGSLIESCNDPEKYEHIEGSGWTILPDTFTYWVNTISYQPNNSANPSRANSVEPPDPSDDENAFDNSQITPRFQDTFLIALGAHFTPRANHDTRLTYFTKVERWLRNNKFISDHHAPAIKMSTIAEWHLNVFDYNIRIFSNNGNVIYHKWFPYDNEEPSECINILYNNKKFSYIKDLWNLLKEKRDRPFCSACKKFHSHLELCKKSIRAPDSEDIRVPEMPPNKHSLVIYADFESVILNNEHVASGYCYVMIENGTEIKRKIISALDTDDVALHFIKSVIKDINEYAHLEEDNSRRGRCEMCLEPIIEGGYVYGRNFINGYAGYHHEKCWNDFKNTAYIFFHNFRGYDSHYVLLNVMKEADVQVLRGKSFEKFDLISCTSDVYARYTFKDTFNFFPTSLAKLVPTINKWVFTPTDARDSKGVFPYNWFDSIDKLNEPRLPPKDQWFNKLTQQYDDNEIGESIWRAKGFKTFNEYHNYYMLIDVLQLADFFEEFRDSVYKEFTLDPVYCQGGPSLTWQLCLEKYSENIKVIKDPKVYIDIQSQIRGGISQVMTKHVDVEKKGGSILYLDINSLYSNCMEEPLPTRYIAKITELPEDWESKYIDNDHCMLMNVDLHYPEHLHDDHIYYPLAPHKFNGRLCTTFYDKENYLVHSKLLKFYLDNGMVLVKFNYGYIFEQKPVLKEYVLSNILKRQKAESPIFINLFKFLNNSLYGKTCENKFKYKKFSVKDPLIGQYGKRNPFMFKSRNWLEINEKILSEDDVTSITLDKPIQLGFAILEFAKLKMYKFIFDLKREFKDMELIYTDTDSLMIWFSEEAPEIKMLLSPVLQSQLDFEKVPDWFCAKTMYTNKQSGLWSLETDKKVKEFIGLRAKCYCIKYTDNTTTLKNKGVVSVAREENENRPLEFDDYLKCLYQDEDIFIKQVLIRSKMHKISTITQRKLALSSIDEKRATLANKITTIPFGYKGERYHLDNIILPSADLL